MCRVRYEERAGRTSLFGILRHAARAVARAAAQNDTVEVRGVQNDAGQGEAKGEKGGRGDYAQIRYKIGSKIGMTKN